MKRLVSFLAAVLIADLFSGQAHAGSIAPRQGWAVHDTAQGYSELLDSLQAAIKAGGRYLVTQAGPTAAAAPRGVTTPRHRLPRADPAPYARPLPGPPRGGAPRRRIRRC